MQKQKIWRIKEPDPTMQLIISKELGVSPLLAQLLINRGLTTVEQIRYYFDSDLSNLHDPFLLKDMREAVDRILQAIKNEEKILIYGDYDVDGVTGTAVLVRALRELNRNVDYYIPHRLEEGYGLHQEAIYRAYRQGYSLIITVDCGISGIDAAAWARQNGGPEIIITDHHEPPPELPSALAVIDPKRKDCKYPFKDLAGVGVALKVVQAVYSSFKSKKNDWKEYLDLVCLGTVADVVPLLGENRILVKHGLSYLSSTMKPGLRALIDVCGLKGELNSSHVGFTLAPRLNAAGRLGDPGNAVELLLTEDRNLAFQLADKLNQGNLERKSVEEQVFTAAIQMIEQDHDLSVNKVLVLSSYEWHPGVIGLVASRLVERYYRPVLLIALNGTEGKGSARSIPGFNIYQALQYCQENLLGYGGHMQAAGFSLKAEKVEDLRRAINQYADEVLSEEQLIPVIELDGIFPLEDINEQVVDEINRLAPFGQCNPGPLLCSSETEVIDFREVGKDGTHLKMNFRRGTGHLDGIGFNMAAYSEILATAEKVNLAFVPEINEWRGRRNIQLRVKDLKAEELEESVPPDLNKISELHKNSYLLFQPGFILNKLVEYKIRKRDIFLPGINELLPIVSTEAWESLPPDTKIIDNRNYFERMNSLLKLELPKLTVILVGCGYQTIELAQYLRGSRPELKNEIAYYYLFMNQQEALKIKERLSGRRIRVLVTTPESAHDLKLLNTEKILLYHLPYANIEWSLICNIIKQTSNTKELNLLFGLTDFEINKYRLKAVTPTRNILISLYTYFRKKKAVSGQNIVEINIIQIVEQLNSKEEYRVSNFMVQLGINVLEELGLIKYRRKGLNYIITLLPAPKKKLNLRESDTFNWCQDIMVETDGFSQFLLKCPVTEFYNNKT
ncbi:single-stranded-DNA-specific exonuclease RecJ [Desulfolucanica intricata]|uniref:single-stranded-DNA-specific exonuclease RecJ n=1 Tax=Desulfolucanica intricata TaxID=1285191 RepID=UPI00082F2810|nr:single-stranded-DNA-specific exonuclease RecJ [Desulfolucanica intricata]